MFQKPKITQFLLIVCLSANVFTASAQIGGRTTYAFLRLPQSARVVGLGGALITVRDDDAALALSNPAVLNSRMSGQISLNTQFFAPEISGGYAAYAHKIKAWNVHGGVQYMNYGSFKSTDATGAQQGDFRASETAITVGTARRFNRNYSLGLNARFISSQLEQYQSAALAGDIGLAYQDTSGRFAAALVLRNFGGQIKPYRDGNYEALPTELQFGISQRLKHLPFRLSVVVQHLERWNIRYEDPNAVGETNIFGQTQTVDTSLNWLDNAARHFNVGGEFLLGKKENFRIRFGYNHLLRSELLPKDARGFVGLSFGAGLKISKFRIEYGHQIRHFAGGTNMISIAMNLNDFKKKTVAQPQETTINTTQEPPK